MGHHFPKDMKIRSWSKNVFPIKKKKKMQLLKNKLQNHNKYTYIWTLFSYIQYTCR